MEQKILIALFVDQVAPRFDLATEVFIASMGQMAAGLSKKRPWFYREPRQNSSVILFFWKKSGQWCVVELKMSIINILNGRT